MTSATIFTLADARLLSFYFTEVAPGDFTENEQRLVSGFGSRGSIPNLSHRAARIDATYSATASEEEQGAEVSLPELEPLRYSSSQPDGIRATVYDHTVNVYGVDPLTGFAARPLDNRGVQYGLDVLNRDRSRKPSSWSSIAMSEGTMPTSIMCPNGTGQTRPRRGVPWTPGGSSTAARGWPRLL